MDRLVSTLSGGNQQKVILGRWLADPSEAVILNGPTVGVDIGAKYDIHQLLRELSQEGMSVIIISDDIAEIFACSDRIVVMKHGRLCGEFITREIDEKTLSDAMFGNDGDGMKMKNDMKKRIHRAFKTNEIYVFLTIIAVTLIIEVISGQFTRRIIWWILSDPSFPPPCSPSD